MNYKKLSRIRLFLLDMDGTFYLGHKLLPGALEFIEFLKNRETQYMFLTNNSSRSSKEYAEKIRQLGVAISEDKIFTSGEATAIYLSRQKPGARIYLVGTPELAAEFDLLNAELFLYFFRNHATSFSGSPERASPLP